MGGKEQGGQDVSSGRNPNVPDFLVGLLDDTVKSLVEENVNLTRIPLVGGPASRMVVALDSRERPPPEVYVSAARGDGVSGLDNETKDQVAWSHQPEPYWKITHRYVLRLDVGRDGSPLPPVYVHEHDPSLPRGPGGVSNFPGGRKK